MYQDVASDVMLFIDVIDSGSFTAAGKKLGISKPSVSRRINELEAHLKTQLIKRTTRKLALTEAGRILYDQCKSIPLVMERVIQEISERHKRPVGEIKIGISSYFANDPKAMQVIANFMTINPGVSVEVHSFTVSSDIDLIGKNLDLYFTDNDMTSPKLISKLLCKYPIKLCATPAYIQQYGTPMKPSDLLSYNCLLHYLYEQPKNNWNFYKKNKLESIDVSGKFHASRTHFLLKMVRAGIGIGLLPEFMISKYLKNGELITLLNDYRTEDAEVYITLYRQKNVPKRLAHFLDYIKSQYRLDKFS